MRYSHSRKTGRSAALGKHNGGWRLAGAVALVGLLAACSVSSAPTSPSGSSIPVTTHTNTVVASTQTLIITSTPPPPATAISLPPEPEPVVGTCPYLSDEFVQLKNGQRLSATKTVALQPYPGCEFFRRDGVWNVAVRVYQAPTPAEATALVDGVLPRDHSNPASLPGGWEGGAMKFKAGDDPRYPEASATFGVSKGTHAVIVWTNQDRSFPAKETAEEVIKNLGLS